MKQLTGKNIRAGIDIEVPIEDIFNPDISSEGDIRVKHFFENEKNERINDDESFLEQVKDLEIVEYREFLITESLSPTLKVAVFNEYQLVYNRFSKKKFPFIVRLFYIKAFGHCFVFYLWYNKEKVCAKNEKSKEKRSFCRIRGG